VFTFVYKFYSNQVFIVYLKKRTSSEYKRIEMRKNKIKILVKNYSIPFNLNATMSLIFHKKIKALIHFENIF